MCVTVCVYIYMYMYIYVCVYMYVCVCVCHCNNGTLVSIRYAIRESSNKIKLFKNFKEKKAFKPDLGAEGIGYIYYY